MRREKHIELPPAVQKVTSKGRTYFYYQAGRNTAHAGPRIKLPDDPHSPAFWAAVQQAGGILDAAPTDTIGGLIDAYIAAWPGLPRKLAPSTQAHYRRYLKRVRDIWGHLPAEELQPKHVDGLIRKIGADRPAAANNILDALKGMCNWARGPRDLLHHDPTHGVVKFASGEGFKPWTPAQLQCADDSFTGVLRRAYVLGRYTGQRASDIIRLGWNDVDGDVIPLRQKKSGAMPVCPILPELEREMRTWEKRPGPFLLQERGRNAGKPLSTNQLWKVFNDAREDHPELEGAVWHGLRANACIRHRLEGKTALQISDMVGLSVEMVERYCRHADRKAQAEATVREFRERENGATVKPLKNLQRK